MANCVVNELLCYVQNNFFKHPRSLVGVAVNGFYGEEEITAAKMCLYGILEANKSKVDGLPRLIKRQASDSRKKLECEDIINMFAYADGVKLQLPTFVAANLLRLPSVAPGDVDVYAMAATVATLMSQVESLIKKVDGFSSLDIANQMDMVCKRLDICESVLTKGAGNTGPQGSDLVVSKKAGITVGDPMEPSNPTWAQRAARLPPVIRVKGSASQTSVKAIPRPPSVKLVKAFVGRLDLETTEDDLRNLLAEAGVNVVHCRKLKPKEGQSFKTSAFYVACSEECEDLFYKEQIWPEGAELRDWYTKE